MINLSQVAPAPADGYPKAEEVRGAQWQIPPQAEKALAGPFEVEFKAISRCDREVMGSP